MDTPKQQLFEKWLKERERTEPPEPYTAFLAGWDAGLRSFCEAYTKDFQRG